ncbi:SpoIIE family protein phosphatase [Salidesulfovibrio onnuriiensis]|uniref:SpoIIE family protein phosphatase n=1 Tax=Salidesulfovibrio onnuriiensis TaxID=2583823 RepID=UPI0011CA5163|nr:SpoIIE family protein phosphatase [Salidesulfovibrio onnuriiensis]
MKFKGLSLKIAALTLICTTLILAFIVGYNYMVSRRIIVELAERDGGHLAEATVNRINDVLNSVQKVAQSISYSLEEGELSDELINDLGHRVLSNNPEIFGTAVAFEPYGFDRTRLYYSPYHYRSGNRIARTNLGSASYRYFYMDWYQLAKELEKPIWTEPYFDEGGGHALMTTYSVPFYRTRDGKKHFAGVVTADVDLGWLQKTLADIKVLDTGFVFLLSRYGSFISHPNKDLVMNETIFTLAEEMNMPWMRDVGRKMRKGLSGFVELERLSRGDKAFLYYLPLPEQNWSLGVVFPKNELFADVTELTRTMIIIAGAGFLLLAALLVYLSRSITSPLRQLTGAAHEIASGNLDLILPNIKTKDEVGDLAASFKVMKYSLKEYIENLTTTTAVKERIESELRIAHDIQMGLLPKLFPAFPERSEFDIYATIEPAREVGGDLYDFFFVDERYFCFLVGDVSGKGVPAAFFMAVTKTLLKVVAERGLDPGDILTKVNADLAEENESCMFVTLFLAIIDIETGELRYANAGHNPPVYLAKGGEPEWLPSLHEPIAGVMEGMEYSTKSMTLAKDDILFIYTDGVTEAMNAAQELYSEDRLMELLVKCNGQSATDLVLSVNESLKAFTGGAEQSDDITMLAMQFCGKCDPKD